MNTTETKKTARMWVLVRSRTVANYVMADRSGSNRPLNRMLSIKNILHEKRTYRHRYRASFQDKTKMLILSFFTIL